MIFERVCDGCGARVPDEADTVCSRCGAPLPQTTPTSVYAPPPEAVAKWKKATTEPPIPQAISSRTLIGVVPPRVGPDPDTDPAGGPNSAVRAAGRATRSKGDVAPPALAATETDLTASLAEEPEGLPTMPIERLPSYTPPPRPEPQPNAGLADTRRQIVPAAGKPAPKSGADTRGLADTLPPPSASPPEGAALSALRTEPDGSFLRGGIDPEVTPPPLVEDPLVGGGSFDAFDELSSPEASTADVKPPQPSLPPVVALAGREVMGPDLAPERFTDTTANVGAHPVELGGGGVSPWLLVLWVVAIASTVAAILVLVLR